MSKIHVSGKMRSSNERFEAQFTRHYDENGTPVESRSLSCEEDYPCSSFSRMSCDNGRR